VKKSSATPTKDVTDVVKSKPRIEAGFISTLFVGATLLPLVGCGLIKVNVNGEAVGGPASAPASHAAKKRGTPRAASQGGAPVAPAPVAPGQVAQYDPAAQAERDRIIAEQELKARGMEVGEQLDALVAESSQIRRFDEPFTLATWYMIRMKMAASLLWVTSSEGTAFRDSLSAEERSSFDAKAKRALGEIDRLTAIEPKQQGSSGTTASASNDRSSSSSGDDSAQRRSSCLSACQRSCPSPSGSGDQWTQSNAAYSQCQNEISSCRMGCP
jgi:hypothetical protein